MNRFIGGLVCLLFLIMVLDVSIVGARPKRVNQIPNGSVNQCATCHAVPSPVPGNGPRNPFGKLIESRFLDGSGESGNVIWNSLLAGLDADNDGVFNGAELQDYFGSWKAGEANPGNASLVSKPGDGGETPLKKLTIQFSGLTPHIGQQLEIRVIDKATGMEVGREEVSSIPSADFSTDLLVLLTGHSYRIDLYADLSGNSLYDAPPKDHAWRLDLDKVSGESSVNFTHNTNFVDIDWKYLLTVRFKDMTPHIGQLLELRVLETGTGMEVGRKRIESIPGADFDVDIAGIELNMNYNVDFYADLNKNFLYDAPGTDHAWRENFSADKGDERVDFSHHTGFTDIGWEYLFQLNFTGMSPHVGQLFELRLFDAATQEEIGEVRLDTIAVPDFVITIPGVALGMDYRADFYADFSKNGAYDAPPTDHAWRMTFADAGGNVVETFTHNTAFTDIEWLTAIFQEPVAVIPQAFILHQNYPNPFNPETKINFEVTQTVQVAINVFDILGQKVKTLVNNEFSSGSYTVDWDGRSENGSQLSSGVYIYQMRAGEFTQIRRMVMMK